METITEMHENFELEQWFIDKVGDLNEEFGDTYVFANDPTEYSYVCLNTKTGKIVELIYQEAQSHFIRRREYIYSIRLSNVYITEEGLRECKLDSEQ